MSSTSRRAALAMAAACALAAWPIGAAAQAAAQKQPEKHQVVIQVSDNDPVKWNLALNNARNLQDDLNADAVDIEIVVYGPGIQMLKADSPVSRRIADALKSGVKVLACENTMRNQRLTYPDMLPDIGYVPAGVVEIMKRQQQGWAYVRP